MPMIAAGAVIAGIVSGTAITAAGVLTVGFSLTAFAASLVLGGLSYALTPKPKKAGAFDSTAQPGTVAVRQSDLTRTVIYGNTRVVRGYAHMVSTNSNADLHLIVILCQGELRAINEIWMDDYAIPSDAIGSDGKVTTGRYAGALSIFKHNGAVDQLADANAILNIPEWTVNHRLQGIAYVYMILNKNQDIYPTGVPNITAIVDGAKVYDPRVSAYVWTSNIALFAYDYITSTYGFAASAVDIDVTNVAAQANICDEIVTVTAEDTVLVSVDPASDILTLAGDLLTLQYGDQVQIASTGTLPTGLAASTNYYIIPYQVKTTPRVMLATSLNNALARTQINLTSAGTGTITLTRNGEPRYHGAGEIDTAQTLSSNLGNLVNSMAGRAVNIAGRWTLLAGAWRTPVLSLGIEDMRGTGLNFKNCLSMSESCNIVKGLFSGPATSYQDTDYPIATYPTFIAQDLGIEATKDLNLPYTTRPTTAQRIAKIELFRYRQDIAYSSDYSMKAMQCQPGDNVGINIDRLGWEDKYFEITQFSFDATEAGLITKIAFRETAEEIFDWSAGEAIDYDPAPNTTLTNPFLVQVPSGVVYDSRFVETRDGDAFYTLQLSWDLHPDAFVREFGDFEVQYKLSDDTDFSPGFFVDGSITHTDVVSASIGVSYDLRIRARNNLGVRSAWSTILGAVVGSSGGVTTSNDWLFVNGSATTFNDWGNVYDAPSPIVDWGYVV